MSSSKEFKDFVLEQLRELCGISCRAMMGEFLLYYNDLLFGGIYDDRFLIKKTDSNKKYKLTEEIPYLNAKPMYLVENLDDTDYLKNLIINTCEGLKNRKDYLYEKDIFKNHRCCNGSNFNLHSCYACYGSTGG